MAFFGFFHHEVCGPAMIRVLQELEAKEKSA